MERDSYEVWNENKPWKLKSILGEEKAMHRQIGGVEIEHKTWSRNKQRIQNASNVSRGLIHKERDYRAHKNNTL